MDLQKSLEDIIMGQASGKIAESVGVDKSQAEAVIAAGLPMILGQMAKNTTDKTAAEKLDAAVAKDHSESSLLESLGGLFGMSQNEDGTKILGHVFGNKQDAVTSKIAAKSGLDSSQVMMILSFVAPLVMAYLGKQKSSKKLDAEGLGSVLRTQTDKSGNMLMDVATAVLDRDKDGSMLDDIIGMFGKR